MNILPNLTSRTPVPAGDQKKTAVLLVGMVFLLTSIGALNGGVALTASVWDALVATLQGMLASTWVLVLAFIALIAALWQLMHGRGYGPLGLVVGILAVALIGPAMVTALATATRSPVEQVAVANSVAAQPSAHATVLQALAR